MIISSGGLPGSFLPSNGLSVLSALLQVAFFLYNGVSLGQFVLQVTHPRYLKNALVPAERGGGGGTRFPQTGKRIDLNGKRRAKAPAWPKGDFYGHQAGISCLPAALANEGELLLEESHRGVPPRVVPAVQRAWESLDTQRGAQQGGKWSDRHFPPDSSHPTEADRRLKTWLWSPWLLCRALLGDPPRLEESQPQTLCLSIEGRAESCCSSWCWRG